MQQIAHWLEKLNLGQYAQRFAENDIDVSVLRHLTDADLEKIGVSLGHRRKILAAIGELPVASPSKHEPAGGVEPKPQETAERRQVTVMFSMAGTTCFSITANASAAKSRRPKPATDSNSRSSPARKVFARFVSASLLPPNKSIHSPPAALAFIKDLRNAF
jgi:hypothetical protein